MNYLEKIKKIAGERGISIPQMSDITGRARITAYKWFKNETIMDVDSLLKLAEYFKVSPAYFVTDVPENFDVQEITDFLRDFQNYKKAKADYIKMVEKQTQRVHSLENKLEDRLKYEEQLLNRIADLQKLIGILEQQIEQTQIKANESRQ